MIFHFISSFLVIYIFVRLVRLAFSYLYVSHVGHVVTTAKVVPGGEFLVDSKDAKLAVSI